MKFSLQRIQGTHRWLMRSFHTIALLRLCQHSVHGSQLPIVARAHPAPATGHLGIGRVYSAPTCSRVSTRFDDEGNRMPNHGWFITSSRTTRRSCPLQVLNLPHRKYDEEAGGGRMGGMSARAQYYNLEEVNSHASVYKFFRQTRRLVAP